MQFWRLTELSLTNELKKGAYTHQQRGPICPFELQEIHQQDLKYEQDIKYLKHLYVDQSWIIGSEKY